METTRVYIFLKHPTPGKVKTRLAASIGPERAAQLYDKMARNVLDLCAKLDRNHFEPVIYYDPFVSETQYQTWLGHYGFSFEPQPDGDLGKRLSAVFENKNYAAVAIGTDCLDMTVKTFERARVLLRNGINVVLGPAADGGYYLIGANGFFPSLFQGISWSTNQVLAQTREKAKAMGLEVEQLEMLSDIDTLEDLELSTWKKGLA